MVNRCDNVEFKLAIGSCLEYTGIDLDFFYARPEELFQGCDDACFLAGAGRTVNEEVGEVATLCLDRAC